MNEVDTAKSLPYTITKGTYNVVIDYEDIKDKPIVLDSGYVVINYMVEDEADEELIDAIFEILPEKTVVESTCE